MTRSPLLDAAFGAMTAKTVHAAAELGLADLLAKGLHTSQELAEQTNMHAPSLRRLLRALAGLGIVAQTGPDRFELAEPGEQLRADAADSVRPLVLMRASPELWRFDTVVDVGGSDGTLLAELLRAHPGLHGVLFDLPAGLADAASALAAAGVADRCRVVAILRNCRTAMAPDARLLLLERVLPELVAPGAPQAPLLDIQMLVITCGRERTERSSVACWRRRASRSPRSPARSHRTTSGCWRPPRPDALGPGGGVVEPGGQMGGERGAHEHPRRLLALLEEHGHAGQQRLRAAAGPPGTRVQVQGTPFRQQVEAAVAGQLHHRPVGAGVDHRMVLARQGAAQLRRDRRGRPGRADDQPLVGAEPQRLAAAAGGPRVGLQRQRERQASRQRRVGTQVHLRQERDLGGADRGQLARAAVKRRARVREHLSHRGAPPPGRRRPAR
jgi:hypothetical protein